MSIWSHVAGIIRVEDYSKFANGREKDFRKIFIESTFENPNDKCNLPEGTEDSIRFEVINKSDEYACIKELVFFGDLRDFGKNNLEEIRTWWKKIPDMLGEGCYIRNAILQVWSEDDGSLILDKTDMKSIIKD